MTLSETELAAQQNLFREVADPPECYVLQAYIMCAGSTERVGEFLTRMYARWYVAQGCDSMDAEIRAVHKRVKRLGI